MPEAVSVLVTSLLTGNYEIQLCLFPIEIFWYYNWYNENNSCTKFIVDQKIMTKLEILSSLSNTSQMSALSTGKN